MDGSVAGKQIDEERFTSLCDLILTCAGTRVFWTWCVFVQEGQSRCLQPPYMLSCEMVGCVKWIGFREKKERHCERSCMRFVLFTVYIPVLSNFGSDVVLCVKLRARSDSGKSSELY